MLIFSFSTYFTNLAISIFLIILLETKNSGARLSPIEPRKGPLSGRNWPPGSPWPLPLSWESTPQLVTFHPESFKIIKNFQTPCEPIDFAIQKYNNTFLFPIYDKESPGNAVPAPDLPLLTELVITLKNNNDEINECSKYPSFQNEQETYEQYELQMFLKNHKAMAHLEATTVWGVLHGIETFSQLIWSNDDAKLQKPLHFYSNITKISDKPRFPHRGLMIDSARHFLPERIFYEVLDGMLYNKMNVLHWHIVDDQSFPYVSQRFPELSQKGAYNDKAIYSPEMVKRVINAARLRGIRVIFEFDTPGHTGGFGKAYPELLTPCYGKGLSGNPEAPNYSQHAGRENLDPTNNFTYKFMREFFKELKDNVTKDSFVHLGMDEVYMGCWDPSRNPVIKSFMEENGYQSVYQVQQHYNLKHVEMAKSLELTPIIWQDCVLDYDLPLEKDVIIQAWKFWGEPWHAQLKKILQKGYRAILSSPWYLNRINYGESWKSYYKADPIRSVANITEEEKKLVVGGEACMWGEFVDKTNIIPRLFPFVSAVAERLWSSHVGITDKAANDAQKRLDQHRCRMLRRGLQAQPILNGYCGRWETENRRKK